eukprot:12920610-Alexandrium_andersonii.AAC.1
MASARCPPLSRHCAGVLSCGSGRLGVFPPLGARRGVLAPPPCFTGARWPAGAVGPPVSALGPWVVASVTDPGFACASVGRLCRLWTSDRPPPYACSSRGVTSAPRVAKRARVRAC